MILTGPEDEVHGLYIADIALKLIKTYKKTGLKGGEQVEICLDFTWLVIGTILVVGFFVGLIVGLYFGWWEQWAFTTNWYPLTRTR